MDNQVVGDQQLDITTVYTPVNATGYFDLTQLQWVRTILVAVYFVLCVIGSFGNALVLYYLYCNRNHSRTNSTCYLIMNLSLCDLFTLTIHLPLRAVEILLPFTTNEPLITSLSYCQVGNYVGYVIIAVGYHTLLTISLERFLLICYPLKSKSLVSAKNAWRIIAFIWIFTASCMLPIPLKYSIITSAILADGTPMNFCMTEVVKDESHGSLSWKVFYTYLFILYYMLPLVCMTFFYSSIFKTLNDSLNVHRVNDPNLIQMLESRKSLSKRLLMIAVIFILLHTPYFITFLCITFGKPIPENPIFTLIILEMLLAMNSMLNPFIYCAQSHTFFQRRMFHFLNTSIKETSHKFERESTDKCSRQSHRDQDKCSRAGISHGITPNQAHKYGQRPVISNTEINDPVWIKMQDLGSNTITTMTYPRVGNKCSAKSYPGIEGTRV